VQNIVFKKIVFLFSSTALPEFLIVNGNALIFYPSIKFKKTK
jgi:hypothetical protein